MSWSLKISHGDLAVDSGHLAIVENEAKLVQDLRHALLEKLGSDYFHPAYGSILDSAPEQGGILGSQAEQVLSKFTLELNRIVRDYQQLQLNRARYDKLTYGKASLKRAEILVSANVAQAIQNEDTLDIVVSLRTAKSDLNLLFPVLL